MFPKLYYFELPAESSPHWRMSIHEDIWHRSEAILTDRSPAERQSAIDGLNYLLGPAIYELLEANADKARYTLPTPARWLRTKIPQIDIDLQSGFPNARWAEYFACLAQATIGRDFDRSIEPPVFFASAQTSAEAMEAVVIAESLDDFARAAELQAKQIVTLRHRKAALRGYERRHQLWDALQRFYTQGEFRSKADAVRQFVRGLSEEDRKALSRVGHYNESQLIKNLVPKLKGYPKKTTL